MMSMFPFMNLSDFLGPILAFIIVESEHKIPNIGMNLAWDVNATVVSISKKIWKDLVLYFWFPMDPWSDHASIS
jgi:hypothetical protein